MKTSTYELSEEQKKALQTALNGNNLFITGGGGVGKSYLVENIVREFRKRGKSVVILAPTGKAALNVGGETLHKFFEFPTKALVADAAEKATKLTKSLKEIVRKTDLFVIDEVSMVRRDVFDAVSKILLPLKKQLVVVGDFRQLPPVVTKAEEESLIAHYTMQDEEYSDGCYAFESKHWKEWNFFPVFLTHVFRQDDKFFVKALDQVALGDPYCMMAKWIKDHSNPKPLKDAPWLCPRRKEAGEVNDREFKKLKSKKFYLRGNIWKDQVLGADCFRRESDYPVPFELSVCKDALVMICATDYEEGYVNGMVGKVKSIDFDKKIITVRMPDGKEFKVHKKTWKQNRYCIKDGELTEEEIASFTQYPLALAYAMTIHKAQGDTLEKVNVIPSCFATGQLYVALSRAKSLNGLHVSQPIDPEYCKADPEVVKFYNSL